MMLYCFLAGDAILIFLLEMFVNKKIHLPVWKIAVFTIAVIIVGLFCAKLMRMIEAGTWEGVSFFGALLFEPLIMILFGLLLHIKPVQTLILGAPAGCVTLVFLKIQCWVTGCCFGRILWYQDNGRPVRFPSQIVEMIAGIVLLIVIMKIIQNEGQRRFVYAWFMLLYGCSRFLLNLLRDTSPFVFGLSAGCFWSLISVAIGGGALLINSLRNPTRQKQVGH